MPSIMKCHLPPSKACTLAAGIDASGLPSDLECHHLVVNQWQDLEAPQNVCIISIPSVFDKSLAPPGKHTIHAYVAGGPAQLHVHNCLSTMGCSRVAGRPAARCLTFCRTSQRYSQAALQVCNTASHLCVACPGAKASLLSVANEPYDIWNGLDRKSQEYQDLKVC